jgi:hypothetical protein
MKMRSMAPPAHSVVTSKRERAPERLNSREKRMASARMTCFALDGMERTVAGALRRRAWTVPSGKSFEKASVI